MTSLWLTKSLRNCSEFCINDHNVFSLLFQHNSLLRTYPSPIHRCTMVKWSIPNIYHKIVLWIPLVLVERWSNSVVFCFKARICFCWFCINSTCLFSLLSLIKDIFRFRICFKIIHSLDEIKFYFLNIKYLKVKIYIKFKFSNIFIAQ